MAITDTRIGYGFVTIINHWTIAGLILGLIAFGLILESIPYSPDKGFWIHLHMSLGLLALLLTLIRIGWRTWQPGIVPFANQAAWEPKAAKAVHLVLIVATVLVPLSGVLGSIYGGHDVAFFGIPLLAAQGDVPALKTVTYVVHEWGSYLILIFVAGHALMALKHHFIDGDTTFRRMLSAAFAKDGAEPVA